MKKNKAVFISLDLEHGGPECDITQLSAQLFRLNGNYFNTKNHPLEATITSEIFNEYIKPPSTAFWSQQCIDITTLHKNHTNILSALPIDQVWTKFITFLDKYINLNEKGIVVAWKGATCDIDWIYKLTQAPFSSLSFPKQLRFCMDPCYCISKFKSCPFHPSISKLDSLSLVSVYYHAFGNELDNAHSSLVDVKAQTEIVLRQSYQKVYQYKSTYRDITELFDNKDKTCISKEMEPIRPVHGEWKSDSNAVTWNPRYTHRYAGPSGGAKYGPTAEIVYIAKKETSSISEIWFEYCTKDMWSHIAQCSEKYANEDWVREADGGAGQNKKKRLIECTRQCIGARHRLTGSRSWNFTQGYIIAWHAILIYHSAKAGPREPISSYWEPFPYGTFVPFIQNCMPKNAWETCRRLIHFESGQHATPDRANPLYDPLFKLRKCFEMVMNTMKKNWTAGQRICIDESMIKYMGRAVHFVQYNPKKPIKHGIKVFACCCAYTGHILSWEVYVGRDETATTDNSALGICDRLILNAGLTSVEGRILFTDNWYTSIDLAKHLLFKYKWLFVGTIAPTKKKARSGYDIPFLKLSKPSLNKLCRGWSRRATIEVKDGNNKGVVQCTNWKDRKQVMLLHTHSVEPTTENSTTKRRVKGQKQPLVIQCPQ